MPFWSTNFGNTEELLKDPKRNFRFYINIQGISTENGGAMLWYAKQVAKPTFTLAEATHEYLNHTYYYPGKITWNAIEITMVDPGGDPDVVATLAGILVGAEGQMVEEWTLWNAFATEVDFGGTLAYGNDELTEVKLKLRYDWAELNTATEGSAVANVDSKFFDISR